MGGVPGRFSCDAGGVRAELILGIALGAIIAVALIAVFVFGFSQESVDAPQLGR